MFRLLDFEQLFYTYQIYTNSNIFITHSSTLDNIVHYNAVQKYWNKR